MWTSPSGRQIKLIMSERKLGWLKVRPVTDPTKMAQALKQLVREPSSGRGGHPVVAPINPSDATIECWANAMSAKELHNQLDKYKAAEARYAQGQKTASDAALVAQHASRGAIMRARLTELDARTKESKGLHFVTASATPTSMGRKASLSGVELLRRQHLVDGHVGLQRTVQTMALSAQYKSGAITKADIEQFTKEGCGPCESAKMKRRHFGRSPTDKTPPPAGKRWVGDQLALRVPAAGYGYIALERFVCAGTGLKMLFGLMSFTTDEIERVQQLLRAKVRPDHGEIHILRADSHPSHKSKQM